MAVKQIEPRKYAGMKIKKLEANPAREGTRRHAVLDAVLKARTVEKAYATPVRWGRKVVYPRSAILRYAVNHGLIQLGV